MTISNTFKGIVMILLISKKFFHKKKEISFFFIFVVFYFFFVDLGLIVDNCRSLIARTFLTVFFCNYWLS